jgi:hypothetical protein
MTRWVPDSLDLGLSSAAHPSGGTSSYESAENQRHVGYGVMVNITASHAVARGSIPRIRIFCCVKFDVMVT